MILRLHTMSDNEIEDVQFLSAGPSAGKRSVYEPHGLHKCKQLICSPTKAALIVAVVLAVIFCIALIAALSRPPATCQSEQTAEPHVSIPPTAAVATNNETFPWNDIRLPTDVKPLVYDIFMHPNLTTFQFKGKVNVIVHVEKPTDFIIFHIKNLTLSSYELYEYDPNEVSQLGEVKIEKMLQQVGHEQVYLKMAQALKTDHQYMLVVEFSGYLTDNLAGFYRSMYETASGEKRWLATTHFEPTDARAAFPCFDEPQLKAEYSLSMVRETRHISLFNTEKINEKPLEGSPGLVVDLFARSVKMSTYLVAFVVCDYMGVHDMTADGKNVSVYAPPELIEEAALAIEVAPKILSFYEEFYNVPYPLSKSDHIAIPDFAAGAMENWGLITYRLRSLLVNQTTASPGDKQWVVVVIAHELAHQWFGDIVTMRWWNDLWLNEGFASFMEYKGTNHVRPAWNMFDQFLVNAMWKAMSHDGLKSSHPISVTVEDPKEIEEIFDAISYDKGASVIRMLDFFLGEDIFRSGLQHYLDVHKFGNADTADLWKALSTKSDVDVEGIMDTWTRQMGYPVVTVERKGAVIGASQERFLYNPRSTAEEEYQSPYEYKWYIPLSYTSEKSGYNHNHFVWMNKGPGSVTLPDESKWVKFNVNHTCMYRVMYSEDMLQALIDQLHKDHTVFSAADRASLLEDAFALARSGHLNITKALEMSLYLVNEEEYVPWSTAISALSYIGRLMEDQPNYSLYRNFMLALIKKQLAKDLWQTPDDHLGKFFQSRILSEALHLHDKESIKHVIELFEDWMNNNTPLDPNLMSLVYASGAKFGGETEWSYLWEKYEHPDSALEKKNYLRALTACTDAARIQRLLMWSLDPDKVRSTDTVTVIQSLSYNSAGQVLTWAFIKQHWDTIFGRYKNLAFQMKHIIDVSKFFSTEFYYNEVKTFLHENLQGQDQRSMNQALESIEMNIDWLKNNQKSLENWLKKWAENN